MKPWILPAFLIVVCVAFFCAKMPLPGRKYPARLTIKVVTDEGVPVAGAVVRASTFDHWIPGEGFGRDVNVTTTASTDKQGVAVIEAHSRDGSFGIGITEQSRFYQGGISDYRLKEVKDGKWYPWNPVIEVVFKPRLNPIPMYGMKVGDMPTPLELPVKDKPVGFDLMKGDWVAPYGSGVTADLVFTLAERVPFTEVVKPFASTLIVSFSNPLDGIQSVLAPRYRGSELRLPRFAPEAGYLAKLEKPFGRPSEDKPIESGVREDQNYFIRVRTVVDEKGKIQSALYGKILGDISCDVINSRTGYIQFAYCLNPTPLDRNMEFDPKRNLFPNLPSGRRVGEP